MTIVALPTSELDICAVQVVQYPKYSKALVKPVCLAQCCGDQI